MKKILFVLFCFGFVIIANIVLAEDKVCEKVEENQCGPNNMEMVPNSRLLCWSCGDKNTLAYSSDEAAQVTSNSSCTSVQIDSCNPNNPNVIQNTNISCYACISNNMTKYTQAKDEDDAFSTINGNNQQAPNDNTKSQNNSSSRRDENKKSREEGNVNKENQSKLIIEVIIGLILGVIIIVLSKREPN